MSIKPISTQEQQGTKHDQGKEPMSLLSPVALQEMARVLAFGAKKYDPHNWRKGFMWSRLSDASLRHIFKWLNGEDVDPESGVSHIAHAAVNLMMILEHEVKGLGEDDRYKG